MAKAIVFEVRRDGYGIDQVDGSAMTVGELKEILEWYQEDDIIIMSHDRGYTFGSIHEYDMYEAEKRDDGEYHRL